MALYYHQVPRNVGDSITSVISSMMLTQREIKFENMRQEQILRVTKTPKKYVLCEVTNDHCCKVLTTPAKGDKVYCVKIHCQNVILMLLRHVNWDFTFMRNQSILMIQY